MSISEHSIPARTDFDAWLEDAFARTGPFTAFIVLFNLDQGKVRPLCSTSVKIIGTEIDWEELTILLHGSGLSWDGVAIFAEAGDDGPLDAVAARQRLQEMERQLTADSGYLRQGKLFDADGHSLYTGKPVLQ